MENKFLFQIHNPNTTILVDDVSGFDTIYDSDGNLKDDIGNFIQIDDEILEIVPKDSPEGVLYRFIDPEKEKFAEVRIKYNLPTDEKNIHTWLQWQIDKKQH